MSKPQPTLPPPSPAAAAAASAADLGALRQAIPVTRPVLIRVRTVGYAYEFDHGFLWQPDGAEPQAYRWDQVATVNWYASQQYVNGAYTGTQYWLALTGTDGRRLKLSGRCKDPAAKGGRNADPQAPGYLLYQLLARARDTVTTTQLPDAIAALNRGAVLSFSDLQISSAGIEAPKGFVPWPSVKAVNIVQGRVSVRQEGKFLALSSKAAEHIPNCTLFLTLAQTLTRQAASHSQAGA